MEDFHRRGFLKGIIGAIAGSDLVLRTHPKELAAFAPVIEKPVEVWTPNPAIVRPGHGASLGAFLFNEHGERVIMVRNVDISGPICGLVTMHVDGFAVGPLDFSALTNSHSMGNVLRHL